MSSTAESRSAPVTSLWIGRLVGISRPLRSQSSFVLAGVDWQSPEHARIELRARTVRGAWTPWVSASVLGHDSDAGETVAFALVGEPVWTGEADAVQLRSDTAVQGLRVHLIADAAAAAVADIAAAGTADASSASAAQALPLAEPQLPAGPGQPPIIARRAWAGALPALVVPAYGDVQLAFVHHSVNANGYSSAEVPAMLRSIYHFHTHVRGWNDIGYNFAVDAYGRIWEARVGGIDQAVVGAQAGGYNLESFGAVLLGDFEATLPTAAARSAMARLIAWKLALHGVPVTGSVTVEVDPADAYYTRFRPGQLVSLPRVAGHRDGCTTDCPGDDMYFNGMPPLRRAVKQLVGRQVRLTLVAGAPASKRPRAPYAIAPGAKVVQATHLQLASVRLRYGGRLPLHGYLRSFAGTAFRSAPVVVQAIRASQAGNQESVLARAATDADGLWFAMLTARSNLLIRALHQNRPATGSPLLVIGVEPQLELSVTAEGGHEVRASGSVMPPKRHVMLEVRATAGKKDRPVAQEMVSAASGSFSARLRLKPGHYRIAAYTSADTSTLAGHSRSVPIHV